MSGSGVSWAVCKSAPRSRQITTPAPHHSVFYRPDALPATQPTASKHWRQGDWWGDFNGISLTTPVWDDHSLELLHSYYWHCLHSMRSRVYVTLGCLSVSQSVPSSAYHTPLLWVCCWAHCSQIYQSITAQCACSRCPCSSQQCSAGVMPQHGNQQKMRAVPRWQLT